MTKNEESLGKLFGAQLVKSLIDIQATKVLRRLVPEALCHTKTGGVVGRLLLGLEDGEAHPFNLNDLRRLDPILQDECLLVIALDGTAMLKVRQRIERDDNGRVVWALLNSMWAPKQPSA
ncbi:TPA: DUF7673 family protein [Pseudomonas aeruginosa]|uniref:DUF7673 family protein n=1 Tax=Pseudomonas aeruginosa TaxID=287 RepID=UPI00053D27BE|nr:hypothetical protein [Pseudomonas aeruginosa]